MTTQTEINPPPFAPVQRQAVSDVAARAVRGGAVLLGVRLLMQAFVWAVSLSVARLLSPADYGIMTWGVVFIGLADLLSEAGIGKALVQKSGDLRPIDLARTFTFSLVLSVLLYAVLVAVAVPAGWALGLPGFGLFLIVLGVLVPMVPFRTVASALLDRDLRLGRQAAVHVLLSVVQASLVLGLALAEAGYWALTVGAIAGRLMETFALLRFARWRPALAWPFPPAATPDGEAIRGLLRFGLHASLGALLWFVYSNCDFAVVGSVLGVVELGYYSLAFQLISLPVQKLTSSINQAAYPAFCRLRDEPARLRDWFVRLSVLLSFFGTPLMAGLALVAPDALPLVLGPRWGPAVLPFQLLAGVGALMVVSHALPPLLRALGRPDLELAFNAACTLLLPGAFLLGGWLAGVIGVCLAWLLLYPVLVAVLVTRTRSLTGIGLLDLWRAQRPIVGAVLFMSACVLAVRWALSDAEAWLRLGLTIATGVVVYAGVLLALARDTVLADLRLLLRQLRRGQAPCPEGGPPE